MTDPITWQSLAIGLLSVVIAGLGWWNALLWGQLKESRADLRELEQSLPATYARRDDLSTAVHQLRGDLQSHMSRIERVISELRDEMRDARK